jgi:hypothetical protein
VVLQLLLYKSRVFLWRAMLRVLMESAVVKPELWKDWRFECGRLWQWHAADCQT